MLPANVKTCYVKTENYKYYHIKKKAYIFVNDKGKWEIDTNVSKRILFRVNSELWRVVQNSGLINKTIHSFIQARLPQVVVTTAL